MLIISVANNQAYPFLPFYPPTGFIGVFYGSLSVLFDQFLGRFLQQLCQLVEYLNKSSCSNADLLTDSANGYAVQIMHLSC